MLTATDLVQETIELVSLPDVYLRLKSVIDSPDTSMADVAQVICQDPSLTARLLKMVNSPIYGFACKIDTISHAINMLGTRQIHDLVLATTVVDSFSGFTNEHLNMYDFWNNSIYCASTARLIAFYCNKIDTERPFVAGLLHDIGHLVMYQKIPELTLKAATMAQEQQIPLFRAEQGLIGFDYAQVGAELLATINLPESLVQITRNHNEPERTKGQFLLETHIIHLATHISAAAIAGQPLNEELDVTENCLQVIGLKPEMLAQIKQEADEQWQMSMDFIITKRPKS